MGSPRAGWGNCTGTGEDRSNSAPAATTTPDLTPIGCRCPGIAGGHDFGHGHGHERARSGDPSPRCAGETDRVDDELRVGVRITDSASVVFRARLVAVAVAVAVAENVIRRDLGSSLTPSPTPFHLGSSGISGILRS